MKRVLSMALVLCMIVSLCAVLAIYPVSAELSLEALETFGFKVTATDAKGQKLALFNKGGDIVNIWPMYYNGYSQGNIDSGMISLVSDATIESTVLYGTRGHFGGGWYGVNDAPINVWPLRFDIHISDTPKYMSGVRVVQGKTDNGLGCVTEFHVYVKYSKDAEEWTYVCTGQTDRKDDIVAGFGKDIAVTDVRVEFTKSSWNAAADVKQFFKVPSNVDLPVGMIISGIEFLRPGNGTAFQSPGIVLDDPSTNSGVLETESGTYNVTKGKDITGIGSGDSVVMKDVDFTGIKSINFKVLYPNLYSAEGEAFRLYIDDPVKGKCIGYIHVAKGSEEPVIYGTNIEQVKGTHHLFISGNYDTTKSIEIQEVILSEEEWKPEITPVSDSRIIDNYHDTWTAVDMVGRKLADYEETGEIKEGRRDVLMMFWPWFRQNTPAVVIPEVLAKYPEAKDDFYHMAWDAPGTPAFWGQSVFGFYNSMDYWVFRKQAQLLATAGVDAIFTDCTNATNVFSGAMEVLLRAFHDARKDGTDAPKVSFYLQMGGTNQERLVSAKKAYFLICHTGEFKDLWYTINGKPVIVQGGAGQGLMSVVNTEDPEEVAFVEMLLDTFEFRGVGNRNASSTDPNAKNWHWLVEYPQLEWATAEDGRVEMMNLGTAINTTYKNPERDWAALSDPYSKGRSYTEAFGDDFRPEAMYQGYFIREQASRILDVDPTMVYVCGWNEWQVGRVESLYDEPNPLIDQFDDENSRDIEPTKGKLKDTYYMILTDFIRKYKGTRPAPVARGAKTIDINGKATAWDNVGPIFYNDYSNYERDALGYADAETKARIHYTTDINNSISRAKVSFDKDNLYFYVSCEKDIVQGHENFMNLYLNTDRNYVTGWEGYDYVLNLTGDGVLSKFTGNGFETEDIGEVEYTVKGKVMQVKIPRDMVGETETVEIEFKWADSVNPEGELVEFYSEGVVAPIGRFNYLYTEIAQTSLTKEERENLSGVTILKSGAQKMIVEGAKMNVYDKDIRVSAYEENGTIYIPMTAVEELLGWGKSKVVYDYTNNAIHLRTHDLDGRKINAKWAYTILNSYEGRVEGEFVPMSNPAVAKDDIVYVPASMLAECFGYTVKSFGDGVYALGETGINDEAVTAVLSHFN